MKDRGKGLLTAALLFVGIIIFCQIVIWMVDNGMNGVIINWVVTQRWFAIKELVKIIFIVVVFLIVFSSFLSAVLYARHRSQRDVVLILRAMDTILSNRDEVSLPRRYVELESQIIKIKALTMRQQQLAETETQRKNDLITYLAHDLKTPLASVIGYLSLLDEAPDMPPAQKAKYVGIALKKAYRLEELIGEFFDITRFNLQTIALSVGRINLTYMLQQMADEFYPLLTPEDKTVTVAAQGELVMMGDADKLARVFNNILKNAVAYSYPHTTIEVGAWVSGREVVIEFKNQGDPIPARQLETIFEKFYRLDSARSSRTGGAGLGLAIARDIVTAHGGTITAASDTRGTRFTVTLPTLPGVA